MEIDHTVRYRGAESVVGSASKQNTGVPEPKGLLRRCDGTATAPFSQLADGLLLGMCRRLQAQTTLLRTPFTTSVVGATSTWNMILLWMVQSIKQIS
jgi:hypothetical protein